MIQTQNGEIEIKKDYKKAAMYALAFLLALGAFLVIYRIGAVTKFVDGSQAIYEGVVSDSASTGIPVSSSPFYRKYDTRNYIGLNLNDGTGLCIYSASYKAPDRKKYGFPRGLSTGDMVRITAAEEVGTGLMVVQDVQILAVRDDTLDYIASETECLDLPASLDYKVTDTHDSWLGDGVTFGVIKYTGNAASAARSALTYHTKASNSRWHALPMTSNLQLVLYGGYDSATHIHYGSGFSNNTDMLLPEIKNGWWFFKNRHSSATSKYRHDDRELLHAASYNFTAAIYDADTDTFYYIEIDT